MIKAARIAIATLVLGGCSHQPASDEPRLVATVVTESEFREINEAVTPEMLLGHWGFGGVCENDIVIQAGGAFTSAAGAGTWTLEGNMLNMVTDSGTTRVGVGTTGADQLVFMRQDRSADVLNRCP